jgi:glycosyltransferase involved in cell wall biosynthesis
MQLPFAVVQLRGLIQSMKPDLVEGDEPMPAIAAGLASRGAGRPVVVYRRHHHGRRARLVMASRLAARLADRTIVSSEPMKHEAAQTDGTPYDQIEVTSSGTAERSSPAHSEVMAARRALGIADDAQVIGAVSRLRREKGLDVLVRALELLNGVRDAHLIIVGTGPEESLLRLQASRSRVPVHFLGHRDDVELWLAICDVVVMPSRNESLGRVTLETMAAARPLIASRVGGLAAAVIDGETGLHVPPDDEQALAAAIGRILRDGEMADRMGQAARRIYESQYTMEHMANAWAGGWMRALAGANGRGS